MCCENTYSGIGDQGPLNVVLWTVTAGVCCSADAIKWEILRNKFLQLWNGSCVWKRRVKSVPGHQLQLWESAMVKVSDSRIWPVCTCCSFLVVGEHKEKTYSRRRTCSPHTGRPCSSIAVSSNHSHWGFKYLSTTLFTIKNKLLQSSR